MLPRNFSNPSVKIKKIVTLYQNQNSFEPTILFVSMFVCKNFFPFRGNFSTGWKFFYGVEIFLRGGNFMCYDVFRTSASYQVELTYVLIVLCVISRISCPPGHSAVKLASVYKPIYFG